jgi:hypothetical protein
VNFHIFQEGIWDLSKFQDSLSSGEYSEMARFKGLILIFN